MNVTSRLYRRTVRFSRSAAVALAAGTLSTGLIMSSSASPASAQIHTGPPVPTMTTTPSSGDVGVGGKIFDTATVTGNDATGTVLFTLFPPSEDNQCVNLKKPIFSSKVRLVDGTAVSGSYTVGSYGTGTYTWIAYYSGDKNNFSNSSSCSQGRVIVEKIQLTITTELSSSSVGFMSPVTDTAFVTGGNSPTGTVTFNIYTSSDTTCSNLLGPDGPINLVDGSATSDVLELPPGDYEFTATYSGDANNPSVTSACGSEPLTVTFTPQ
jgi:Big-like domain-containing protein